MIIKPLVNIKREIKSYITFNNNPVKVDEVFFFDVETAPEYSKLGELLKHDPEKYELFVEKYKSLQKFDVEYEGKGEHEVYDNYTGLMAEYCKVVCISFGYVSKGEFKTGSIAIDGINFHNEKEVIENFAAILQKSKKKYICGANIVLFDVPLLCKKFFSYGVLPPSVFWWHEAKPWTSKAIDISDIWRGKARMRDARLKVICHMMGVKNPKDGMEGKDVGRYFYEGRINEIADYCEGDVQACYELFVKFQQLELLS